MILVRKPTTLHIRIHNLHRVLRIHKPVKVLLHQVLQALIALGHGCRQVVPAAEQVLVGGVPVDVAEEVPRVEVRGVDIEGS
jgi:hypothetical protein